LRKSKSFGEAIPSTFTASMSVLLIPQKFVRRTSEADVPPR
jgi:hypothetical protein